MRQSPLVTIQAYRGTTAIVCSELQYAEGLRFSTFYPGGLHGDCSFFLPGSITRYLPLRGGDKLVLKAMGRVVWMGIVHPTISYLDEGNRQGTMIQAVGWWGARLMRRLYNNAWTAGTVTPAQITKDIRAIITSLSTNESYISANALDLTPFESQGYESCASLLQRASAFGDTSYNPWAVYIDESYSRAGDDPPKGILVLEQQPDVTTGYDYAVRLEELEAPVSFDRDWSQVYNWIAIEYTDSGGTAQAIDPDSDATLKDQTSIDEWWQADKCIDIGKSNATAAANYGRRVLAQMKSPKYRMSGPIVKKGRLRTSTGEIPVAWGRAGKRIKIENFLADTSGTGLTLLVTDTEYNADTDTLSLTSGAADPLAVLAAQANL